MRVLIVRVLLGAYFVAFAGLALMEPAFACFPACTLTPAPNPAPGPLIGFGLPLAAAAVGALLAVRHFRQKD